MLKNEDPELRVETLSDDELESVSGGVDSSSLPQPGQTSAFHGSDFNGPKGGASGQG